MNKKLKAHLNDQNEKAQAAIPPLANDIKRMLFAIQDHAGHIELDAENWSDAGSLMHIRDGLNDLLVSLKGQPDSYECDTRKEISKELKLQTI